MIRMALKAHADQVYRFPLGCDPDVLKANKGNEKGITSFVKTGDLTAIVIPDTVTWFTMRAISADDADAAESAAGRMPHYAMLVGRRISEAAEIAGAAAAVKAKVKHPGRTKAAQKAVKKAAEAASTLCRTKALDALDDEDTAEIGKLKAWNVRVLANKVAASISSVEDSGVKSVGGGEFIKALTSSAHHMAGAYMNELTQRYRQISELAEGPKGLLNLESGCRKSAQLQVGSASDVMEQGSKPAADAVASL